MVLMRAELSNADRADSVLVYLRSFMNWCGLSEGELGSAVSDMITNMLHHAHRSGRDVDDVLHIARANLDTELEEFD
jgi:hypothetical protein